ncbi:MAG: hypothetical protein FWD85_13700 [Microbacteriaceae bacterium]|nr:hypothetical protein [Microbacteriaceae bacterium]
MARRRGASARNGMTQTTAPAPKVSARFAVRPGNFNLNGDFFTPDGNRLERISEDVSPAAAQELVRGRAAVAFEGCGCGGGTGSGCVPVWPDRRTTLTIAAANPPRFTDRFSAPTWIDVWRGERDTVVFMHGDVEWGTLFD